MSIVYGQLLDVQTKTVGEPLTADAAATALVISVVDATTFREEGGLLKIGQDVYTYTSIDTTLNTITLASGLLRAVVADDFVEVSPQQQVKRAFVDTGITGGDTEGVWATIPQGMVLTLADGMRYEGQRETVLLNERGPGNLIIQDVKAAANIASSTVLPEGSVDSKLLEVGVTGNIVQDPDFTRSYWQPPRKWTVAGPDTVYTDSNFMRNTATAELGVTEPGADQYDSSWWLTDVTPVDPGRSIRIHTLVRRDATAGGTGAGPNTPRASVRVVFYKSDLTTTLSTSPYYTSLVLATDLVVDTWEILEQTSLVPEGYTYFKAGVQVTGAIAGNVDFIKPEVQVVWNRVQSDDYVRGASGWSLEGGISQFPSMNVLDTIGAGVVSARTITVNGVDLQADILNPLPLGVVAYDNSPTTGGIHTGSVSTPEVKLFEFSWGPSVSGRLYRVFVHGHIQGSVTGDSFDIRIRYTTNASSPTITSAVLPGSATRINIGTQSTAWSAVCYFTMASLDTVRFGINLLRAIGTGTAFIFLTAAERRLEISVEDLGLYVGAAAAGTLSQKSYSDATPPQPDPLVTTTKTWYATWGRSYREAAGTTLTGDPAELYQGVPYYASDWGNSRSLFGFDYAAIQTALSGATINSVKLTYRTKDVYEYSPYTTVFVSSHNYTTKPSTWSSGSVTTNRANFSGRQMGVTYVDTLPIAIGNEFKAGTTRGLGFGPGAVGYDFGSMYGAITSADRPRLTITYTK